MTRIVSSLLVYPLGVAFKDEIEPILKRHLKTRLLAGEHAYAGSALVYSFDFRVNDDFELHRHEDHLNSILPNAYIRMIDHHEKAWWARYKWNVLITLNGGLGVVAIVEGLRLLLSGR